MPSLNTKMGSVATNSYVYRYVRLDKNEPFYIGISNNHDNFKRAYDTHSKRRNRIFVGIVKKTEYEVEILFENLTWEQACEKEKEFIKLYGRKNINTGTLANMTNGGDGSNGLVLTEEQRKAISLRFTGRRHKEEAKKKNREAKLKYYRDNPEVIEIISKRMKSLPVDYERLHRMSEINKKPVVCLNMNGEFIKEYESVVATEKDGFTSSSVSAVALGRYKRHKNYKFMYLKDYKKY